jgi:hypothetical protein
MTITSAMVWVAITSCIAGAAIPIIYRGLLGWLRHIVKTKDRVAEWMIPLSVITALAISIGAGSAALIFISASSRGNHAAIIAISAMIGVGVVQLLRGESR